MRLNFLSIFMACVLLQACSLTPVVEVNGQTALTYYGGSQLAFDEINKQLATMFPEASEPPKLRHYVLPQMTKEEKNQGYEGIVKAQFLVGRDGRVSEVKIPVSPAAPLTDAVVRAVSQ